MTTQYSNDDQFPETDAVDNNVDNVVQAFADDVYGADPEQDMADEADKAIKAPVADKELLAKSAAKGVKFSDFNLPDAIRQFLRNATCHEVSTATGHKRHQHAHRLFGISARHLRRRLRCRSQRQANAAENHDRAEILTHLSFPLFCGFFF